MTWCGFPRWFRPCSIARLAELKHLEVQMEHEKVMAELNRLSDIFLNNDRDWQSREIDEIYKSLYNVTGSAESEDSNDAAIRVCNE